MLKYRDMLKIMFYHVYAMLNLINGVNCNAMQCYENEMQCNAMYYNIIQTQLLGKFNLIQIASKKVFIT